MARFIQEKNPDHAIYLLDLVTIPDNGEEGLFGIIDRRKGMLLRATASREEAEFLTQDDSRGIVLCRVKDSYVYAPPLCNRPS